jgi:hypothetical protein
MWITLASSFIPIFAVLISTDSIDAGALLNPKLLYYTPGLWEETGAAFWGAFLFEKAHKQYQKTQEDKYGK